MLSKPPVILSKPPVMNPPATIRNINLTAHKISEALAKFFLFRLAEEPKPHTNSRIMLRIGTHIKRSIPRYCPTRNGSLPGGPELAGGCCDA